MIKNDGKLIRILSDQIEYISDQIENLSEKLRSNLYDNEIRSEIKEKIVKLAFKRQALEKELEDLY